MMALLICIFRCVFSPDPIEERPSILVSHHTLASPFGHGRCDSLQLDAVLETDLVCFSLQSSTGAPGPLSQISLLPMLNA